jgi:hypothetical protein
MAILLGLLDPKAGTTRPQHTINPATLRHVPEHTINPATLRHVPEHTINPATLRHVPEALNHLIS